MRLSFLIDIVILFALLGGLLLGLRRGLVKTLLSVLMLLLATVFAALLYAPLIGLFAGLGGGAASQRTGAAMVFFGLLVVFYVILEYTLHRNYPNLRIKALGQVDNLLGAAIGVIWAALGSSLILLIVSYTAATMGGQGVGVSEFVNASGMTVLMRRLFSVPLALIRLLFPQGLPEVLAYFAL